MNDITNKIRNILVDSNEFERVQYIGKDTIEIKSDGIYYNIDIRGSVANLFGSE